MPSGTQYPISAGTHRAVVVEVGAGARSYTHGSRPVLAGYPARALCPRYAGAVFAPWPGWLADGRYEYQGGTYQVPVTDPDRGVAAGGLTAWQRWSSVERHADRVTLGLDPPPSPWYPFALRLRTRWSVGPGGLRADHEVTNIGAEPAPFGLGARPVLDVGGGSLDRVRLVLPGARRLVEGAPNPVPVRGTPYDFGRGRRLGGLRFDTAYTALRRDTDGTSRVRVSVGKGVGAELWMDEGFGWLRVLTLTGTGEPDAVAIEPATCAPNAFNSPEGPPVLAPGETWRGGWGVRPLVD